MKRKLIQRKKMRDYAFTTPTAVLLANFFFLVFALFSILSIWVPSLGQDANFPNVIQPIRAIFGGMLIIFIVSSIFYIPDKYCLFVVYFLSALRIADSLFGAVPMVAFLWFGGAIICTYSVYHLSIMDHIVDKRIEKKIKEAKDNE